MPRIIGASVNNAHAMSSMTLRLRMSPLRAKMMPMTALKSPIWRPGGEEQCALLAGERSFLSALGSGVRCLPSPETTSSGYVGRSGLVRSLALDRYGMVVASESGSKRHVSVISPSGVKCLTLSTTTGSSPSRTTNR